MGSSLRLITGGVVPDPQQLSSPAREHLDVDVISDHNSAANDSPRIRLVIVEDDFIIYKSLKTILTKYFPAVRVVGHCETVQEVTDLIGAEKPDIVLLDIQVRGGSAFKGLSAIPDRTFDIIVMSAQAQFQYAQEAIRFGATEYLVKPFQPEDIIASLEKVIEKRSKQSADTETLRENEPTTTTQVNTSPLRAIIVDDEKAQRSALRYKVEETFGERITLVGEAFSVDSAIAVIKEHQPELVFLDIELIGGTGFDVLDAFANTNFAVIFVTSYPEFGARAFRYDAIDFILKPIDPAHLQKAVERVFSLRNVGVESNVSPEFITPEQTTDNASKEKSWTIKAKDRTVYILEWEQIIHLQADGKYAIVYHTKGKPFLIAKTLQECSQELPETVFYQTHRSHIINRTYFSYARDGFAFLTNGEKVDVALKKWSQFLTAMKK